MDLPAEILTQIFDLAADEDVIFQYGLPTVMAESAWFKSYAKKWTLRSPGDALNLIQRRSYATKKVSSSSRVRIPSEGSTVPLHRPSY